MTRQTGDAYRYQTAVALAREIEDWEQWAEPVASNGYASKPSERVTGANQQRDLPGGPGPRGMSAAGTRPDAADDATILARSLAEPELFAVVYRRHAPAIQRYVTRRIGAQDADDVVTETFLAAFAQRATFRADGRDCLPWLYGIATNLLGRHRRAELRRLRSSAGTWAATETEPFTDRVDDRVSAQAAKARLAAALARLPASQRDALLLFAWAGLPYEQVAAATGVPLGTVQSRISRARASLRRALADLGPAVFGLSEQPRGDLPHHLPMENDLERA
jgi:RNA polymerase sigma-70 factor (ECF subfamily)